MIEKNINKLSQLKSKIDLLSNKLDKISSQIISAENTSNTYWNKINSETKKIYEEMRMTFKAMYPGMVESEYYEKLKSEILRIKKLSFKKPKTINYSDIYKSNSHWQTVNSVIQDGLSSYLIGLDSGQKTLNQFMRLSQQILVSEDKLNKDVTEGFFEKGSKYGVKKKIYNSLMEKIGDGKYITIINKNGKEMHYDPAKYAEMVARTKIIESNSMAALNTALDVGSDLVQVSSHNTSTPLCQEFEGKIFSISGKDPDFPQLEEMTPFHPNPFSKDTEILTDKGWVNIADVKINDICISLNTTNFNLEKVKVLSTIKRFEKKIIKFKNKYCEIKVANDHNMFYQMDNDRKKKNNKFIFIEAEKLLNKKSGRFYASSLYHSNNNIDNLYCRFMGYYLADGSTDGNKICISKTDRNLKDREIIVKDLKKLFPNTTLTIDLNAVRFTNKELAEKLKPLGKCNNKYIPDEIMNSSVENINNFLYAYCLCDGNIKHGKIFKGYQFKESKTFFTTSKRMAEQIGELILKSGKRPSFRTQKPTGKLLKFPNGYYKSKLDLYVISECNNVNISLQNMDISEIDYNDFVYCVSLEKNFTLLTRTNGQVVWCGNCQHSISVIFREVLEDRGIQKYIDFSNGTSEEHPTRKSHIPVSER